MSAVFAKDHLEFKKGDAVTGITPERLQYWIRIGVVIEKAKTSGKVVEPMLKEVKAKTKK